jgi:hypothetical protein
LLARDRSDENQRLTAKFLIDWSEAILKDLKRLGPMGQLSTPRQLLRMRAEHPNILVAESFWNDQVEQIRAKIEIPNAFCVHPSVHADTYMDTLLAV